MLIWKRGAFKGKHILNYTWVWAKNIITSRVTGENLSLIQYIL